jgi:hypothetical protein
MKIINCTPHAINIVEGATFETKARKFMKNETTKAVCTIQPSGIVLNAKAEDAKAEDIEYSTIDALVPTKKTVYVSVDSLPGEGDMFLVSALFVSACKDLGIETSKLLTVGDPVYDSLEKPFPIGALNLRRN